MWFVFSDVYISMALNDSTSDFSERGFHFMNKFLFLLAVHFFFNDI